MVSLPLMIGNEHPLLQQVRAAGLQKSRPAWLLTHPDLRRMERVRVFAGFLADALFARKNVFGGTHDA